MMYFIWIVPSILGLTTSSTGSQFHSTILLIFVYLYSQVWRLAHTYFWKPSCIFFTIFIIARCPSFSRSQEPVESSSTEILFQPTPVAERQEASEWAGVAVELLGFFEKKTEVWTDYSPPNLDTSNCWCVGRPGWNKTIAQLFKRTPKRDSIKVNKRVARQITKCLKEDTQNISFVRLTLDSFLFCFLDQLATPHFFE